MNIDLLNLPNDVDSLKNIIHFQAASYQKLQQENINRLNILEQRYTSLESNLTRLQTENNLLREQVQHLTAKIYDRKSEKSVYNQDQLSIFNEAEEITVPAHTRKKGGRRLLPSDLPREEVVHDLSEEEKVCDCGSHLSRIGEEVTERLDYVPAKMRVIKHVRIK